jgi:hypothetical protein
LFPFRHRLKSQGPSISALDQVHTCSHPLGPSGSSNSQHIQTLELVLQKSHVFYPDETPTHWPRLATLPTLRGRVVRGGMGHTPATSWPLNGQPITLLGSRCRGVQPSAPIMGTDGGNRGPHAWAPLRILHPRRPLGPLCGLSSALPLCCTPSSLALPAPQPTNLTFCLCPARRRVD